MNIETTKINSTNTQSSNQPQSQPANQNSNVKFSDELKNLNKPNNKENTEETTEETTNVIPTDSNELEKEEINKIETEPPQEKEINTIDNSMEELNGALKAMLNVNYSEEKEETTLKKNETDDEIDIMLDNDINIREKELINQQMNASMSFNSSGQTFSDLMNENKNENLSSSTQDLAEEKAILSTMNDNYMMAKANSNGIVASSTQKTEQTANNKGENFETIIMNRADVDFFTSLVDKQELNINDIDKVAQSAKVSKTLADMLAKSMQENKPLRIDFDNNISVIIKISKDGKISADFLPSSQIAEAYLKENLPILKQRFDENNINYGELNQRKHKQDNDAKDNNRKKGGKDE